jgi:hypothetical protein
MACFETREQQVIVQHSALWAERLENPLREVQPIRCGDLDLVL